MFKTITLLIALGSVIAANGVLAAGSEGHVHDHNFSFEGPFGSYDQEQLRRGLKAVSYTHLTLPTKRIV